MNRIREFVKKETVLFIAALCALASMVAVPPDAEYLGYIDFRVLCLLLCLMAVVAGFKSVGAFQWLTCQLLRRIRSDAYIIPNEGRRKIYIFPDCDLFDPKTQNVMLKVLEEGPAHAAFLFCARNSAALLQTIRSRSVEWKISPSGDHAGDDEIARQLCRLHNGGYPSDHR